MNEPGSVVSFCDRTGNMVRPWADAGFKCLCYDWQHSIRNDRIEGNITYRWADVRSLTLEDMPEDVFIAFAFPPCTNLALSGARDFKRKGIQGLIDSLVLVESCRKLLCGMGCPWLLENPMSRLSTCWREPDFKYSPWQYGENYQKETWLWAGCGFRMPAPTVTLKPFETCQSIFLMPPGPERANIRAVTPITFAQAVFAANCREELIYEDRRRETSERNH